MIKLNPEDNINLNESLVVLLTTFRGFMQQLKDLHVHNRLKDGMKRAFESRVPMFENKLREIVHGLLTANVKLENKKKQSCNEMYFQDKVTFTIYSLR